MTPARILMFARYLPPHYSGAARQALLLADRLRERGHHVEFATQCWDPPAYAYQLEGFRVQTLEAGRGSKHREFRLWWNLYRHLRARRRDFDLLHSHGAYYTQSIVGPLGRTLGMRSLVKASLARDDLAGLGVTLSGRLHRWMLGRVDAYVAISRDLAEEFRAGGLPAGRIRLITNGVDTRRFRPVADAGERAALRRALGLPVDRPLALYVGVFDERKNIAWLMQQWAEHQAWGSGACLLAIGPQSRDDPEGVLRGRLERLAGAHPEILAVRDEVDCIQDYYRAADLFVLPSHKEGLPNVVLEAMASGMTCLVTDASGTRELIRHGETGLLFPRDDAGALGRCLQQALAGDGAALGRRARAWVEETFAIEAVADRYEALYAELLGRA